MTEPTAEQFDQLAAESRAGTEEANSALWTAVFSLSRWWFLPDSAQPGLRIGVIDGRPFLLAFTSDDRARQQAVAWGMAAPDGSVNVIASTPQNVLNMVDGMRSSGVFGVTFDHGVTGFFAPLENLRPIYQHVQSRVPQEQPVGGWYAKYGGQEYRADLLADGDQVELIGPGPDFAVDETGQLFLQVPTSTLDELYAVNLTATVGTARCAILATVGDQMRLLTAQPDHSAGPTWNAVDHDVFETVLPSADVQVAGLQTDLPKEPAQAPLILQKVLTPEQTRACFDGRLRHIAGYVAPLESVLSLRTPAQVIEGLELEYPGSPFAATDSSIAVLRFPMRDGTWRLETRSAPRYFIDMPHVMPMPVGAELQLFSQDGTQQVAMRYGGTRTGWRHAV
ncbi:MAG TPA: hypothetical protein VHX59_25175 [Mycobacteriales bacterium]|nr:hypothetical protein [Mycobacteriales bacterium]